MMFDKEFVEKNKDILAKSTLWVYKGRKFLLPKGEEEETKKLIRESIKGV